MAKEKRVARPPLACEITAGQIVAARTNAAHDGLEAIAARRLPPGTLAPQLLNANIVNSAALQRAVAEAMATVAGHARDVSVVLPDAAIRVVLLDFDSLPERTQEAL